MADNEELRNNLVSFKEAFRDYTDCYTLIGGSACFILMDDGVYASPEAWEDESYILSLRCPQGVLSHDEALYYHGLIDREPMQQTITIYTG